MWLHWLLLKLFKNKCNQVGDVGEAYAENANIIKTNLEKIILMIER